MSRCECEGMLRDRDREVLDKCYRYLIRECESPLYALKILRLARRRVICRRNAGRYKGR